MKYYIVSDIHGFYSILIRKLKEKGFFEDKKPHKLIICGDIFDRGHEAKKLQKFVLDLIKKDEVILIRGNHEDLFMDMLNKWHLESYNQLHHIQNGTVDTLLQLTGLTYDDLDRPVDAYRKAKMTPYVNDIIPNTIDYFETKNYIFVHGWIPCKVTQAYDSLGNVIQKYHRMKNWREALPSTWKSARWINGIDAAHCGVIEANKTIICGHWHCSYGHYRYCKKGSEFGKNASFKPYYNKGILAIDACTAYSKKINVVVLED